MPMPQGWENSLEFASLDEALTGSGLDEFRGVFAGVSLGEVTPETIRDVQARARQEALARADEAIALYLRFLLEATNLDAIAVEAFRDITPGSWENKGLVEVAVTLPGGLEIVSKVTYLLERIERKRGRKKRHGNRGATGRGVYPALEALGIDSHRRLSPLLEEEVLLAGLTADAFRVGHEMVERNGFCMSWTGFLTRFHNIGADRFDQYRTWLADGLGPSLFDPAAWKGKRIAICPDGGRMRLRNEFGGRPRHTGYRRFEAAWREPKLFVIYALDDEGNMLEEPRPIVDGIIGGHDDFDCPADELFDVLAKVLMAIGVHDIESISIQGDGADWIWNRARPMCSSSASPRRRFTNASTGTTWKAASGRSRRCRRNGLSIGRLAGEIVS